MTKLAKSIPELADVFHETLRSMGATAVEVLRPLFVYKAVVCLGVGFPAVAGSKPLEGLMCSIGSLQQRFRVLHCLKPKVLVSSQKLCPPY